LIDFGIADTLGPNGKSAHFWTADMFAAPEIINGEETDFGGDIFYLGKTFYSMIHPKRYTPWANGRMDLDSGNSFLSVAYRDNVSRYYGNQIKALEGDRAEFNYLMGRMLDSNKCSRATIDDVCEIL
jgi:hypothetical protein